MASHGKIENSADDDGSGLILPSLDGQDDHHNGVESSVMDTPQLPPRTSAVEEEERNLGVLADKWAADATMPFGDDPGSSQIGVEITGDTLSPGHSVLEDEMNNVGKRVEDQLECKEEEQFKEKNTEMLYSEESVNVEKDESSSKQQDRQEKDSRLDRLAEDVPKNVADNYASEQTQSVAEDNDSLIMKGTDELDDTYGLNRDSLVEGDGLSSEGNTAVMKESLRSLTDVVLLEEGASQGEHNQVEAQFEYGGTEVKSEMRSNVRIDGEANEFMKEEGSDQLLSLNSGVVMGEEDTKDEHHSSGNTEVPTTLKMYSENETTSSEKILNGANIQPTPPDYEDQKKITEDLPDSSFTTNVQELDGDTKVAKQTSNDNVASMDPLNLPSSEDTEKLDRNDENKDGDHDSGVDESTQGKHDDSPQKPRDVSAEKTKVSDVKKKSSVTASPARKLVSPSTSTESPSRTTKTLSSTSSKASTQSGEKKLPMNKVVVGTTASPNLKVVKSKIGSMQNVKHKAGGGEVKLEKVKIDLSNVKSKVGSTDNIQYKPTGGERKVMTQKLEWKAQSKIGSLDNASHKAGGGNKKIETQKLDFKVKAKPKVGSKEKVDHKPGGGTVQIEEHKVNFKESAKSKIGSLDNVKHKPGGGAVQIYDEKLYYKPQQSSSSKKSSLTGSDGHISDTQSHSPQPSPNNGASPTPNLIEIQDRSSKSNGVLIGEAKKTTLQADGGIAPTPTPPQSIAAAAPQVIH